jgi:predicted nucleic acid-binding protein
MGAKHLIDTNILIYFLNGKLPDESEVRTAMLSSNFSISSITLAEILGWKKLTHQEIEKILKELKPIGIIPADESICVQAGKIKREYNVQLGDAIIAATALESQLSLVTNDLSDFKNITNLMTIHPFSL